MINSDNRGENTESNKKRSSINANFNSQNRKIPVSSKLTIYMNKEINGISLYTHIQALLDMFIFQNPIKPITYFEFYSEQLKQYYKTRPDPDVEFLNNINKNNCDRTINIYKDFNVKNNDIQLLKNKSIKSLTFEEYNIEYEDEESINNTIGLNEIVVQDLSKTNYMFNKAGCGISNDEANLIGITMNQKLRLGKFKNIRYWGKILGIKRNYFVLECEWNNEELEYQLKILNSMKDKNKKNEKYDYDNIYENEEEMVEIEKDNLSMNSNEMVENEQEIIYDKTFSISMTVNKKNINEESDVLELKKSLCIYPPSIDGYLSHEMIGFGANKKLYFVTNELNDEWVELPLLRPHHIIQSRDIKRYFIGDLESHVDSYPLFQGLEKHYLRAQIARITAATQISPHDYFVLGNKTKSNKWKKLNPFQSKVLSHKWFHDCVINQNYDPLSLYDLLKPDNWVHHIPLISDEGVTVAWKYLIKSENYENKDDDITSLLGAEQIANENYSTTDENIESDKYADIFVKLSEDAYVGEIPPWKFELSNPFDSRATYVIVKSNVWPGAFVVAREKLLDYTYCGWGQKLNLNCCTKSITVNLYQSECPIVNEEITELNDPTYDDELAFIETVNQLKKEKANMKAAMWNYSRNFKENDEENYEKEINQYNYD